MGLGNRLIQLRKEKKYTREQLAEILGISKYTLRNYELEVTDPGHPFLITVARLFDVSIDYLMGVTDERERMETYSLKTSEYTHIEKYRFIAEHSPEGSQVVDTVLDREYAIADKLRKQAEHITKLEETDNCINYEDCEDAPLSNIIEFQPSTSSAGRLIKYFHSASAGTGVFILGNEVTDQIAVPDRPGLPDADYAIKVSGRSMEPDYSDGDIVLVSQRAELRHGDVGIFIVNNNAYIKEYGEHELISRNPDSDNIMIREYDNIVCMGKVIGKLEEPYEIIEN